MTPLNGVEVITPLRNPAVQTLLLLTSVGQPWITKADTGERQSEPDVDRYHKSHNLRACLARAERNVIMISALCPNVKLHRLQNRLREPLVRIVCMSLLMAPAAHAGFLDQPNQATQATQQFKHGLSNLPMRQVAAANSQPATSAYSQAPQTPAARPSSTDSGSAVASSNPGAAAVTLKVLGPLLTPGDEISNEDGTASPYVVSHRGSHLASVHMQGSRYVVTVDGVDGPRVDAVLPTLSGFSERAKSEAVAMSDDGRHYAYLARADGKIELFYDGKKILHFPQHGAGSIIEQGSDVLFFSPHGGKHLFFAAGIPNHSGFPNGELWVDGKPAPTYVARWSGSGSPYFTFSPDGRHYLYIGATGDASSKHVLVVDGKKVGYSVKGIAFGSNNHTYRPRFTADGQHVLCITEQEVDNNPVDKVLLDGKPVVTAEDIDSLVTAPKGDSFAAVVDNIQDQYSVYLNGTLIAAASGKDSGDYGTAVPSAIFSPDGKHLAVALNYGPGNAYVVLDGKKGETYDHIYGADTPSVQMKFSADSQSLAYSAGVGSNGKAFAVVDGREYNQAFAGAAGIYFSPEGHHVAVMGPGFSGNSDNDVLYVDGKRVSEAPTPAESVFAFDRDGSHWMVEDGQEGKLVVDDQVLPIYGPESGIICRFSPDGTELAISGTYAPHGLPQGGVSGLYLYNTSTKRFRLLTRATEGRILGATAMGEGTNAQTFLFSPDSKHLYYAKWVSASGKSAMIYVDGKKTDAKFDIVNFLSVFGFTPSINRTQTANAASAFWYVNAEDKLHALVAVNNKVVRITITPPSGGLN